VKTHSIADPAVSSPSRRRFLSATAAIGGGLLIGFGLPARSQVRDGLTKEAPFAPNAFLHIAPARSADVTSEMGRACTSLPMILAEELEVDVDTDAIEHSPPDDKLYVNPLVGYQLTGGSTAIRSAYVPLRQAGATARVMLVTAAAQRWKVDPSTCRAEKGVVVHPSTGRKLGYGGLVDAAAKLPVPEKVALKDPGQFKLIGTPHRRLDSAGKVNGRAKFGIDARPPGMKFAAVAASPTFGGKLLSVDESKAKAVRGVSQVRLDDAVASLPQYMGASRARAASPVGCRDRNASSPRPTSSRSLLAPRRSPAPLRVARAMPLRRLRARRGRSTRFTSSPSLRTPRWNR
jgi:CO/xanthine dehydrogenase Mo-binding subunit